MPRSAQTIFELGKSYYQGLGLVTVYWTLELCGSLGWIRQVHAHDGCHSSKEMMTTMGERRRISRTVAVLVVFLLVGLVCSCAKSGESSTDSDVMPALDPVELADGEQLRVVATTSIVADVVRNVGGDRVALTQLMSLGVDPHAFEPTPQDAAAISDAHVVFINGLGLEAFLDRLLESAGSDVPAVPVSYGIEALPSGEDDEHDDESGTDEHTHGEYDPHVWFDPNNVEVWVENIETALCALDPAGEAVYRANVQAYLAELDTLDTWIQEEVATIPEAQRELVTDHSAFAYFAQAYGFSQIGVVTAGSSTLAQPSAQELAALEESISAYGAQAIFVGTTVNPSTAEQVAQDAGIQMVSLYTGSLSDAEGPAGTYLAFMRYDVGQIVGALR